MIKVYKFELFDTYKVDARVLTEFGMPAKTITHSFQYMYRDRSSTLIVPIPKNIEVTADTELPHTGKIDIKSLVNTVTDFTFEDKIYLHSDCTIPRAKVTQKYTRVLKANKADICVVPKLERECNTENLAIFLNKEKNKIYVSETALEWSKNKYIYYTAEKCAGFTLGSSILDINPSLRGTFIKERTYYSALPDTFTMDNWKDFLASSLIYYGPVISLYTKESWIVDVLYNKLHDIITEDKLLATLGDSTNEFTKEAYDNLREMLNSSDSTVVGLGLKAVAEMDYEKYRNTTVHLLANNQSRWCKNDMRSSASVKYMLNHLNLWRCTRENYTSTTTQEDFALMQEVVKSDFQEKVEYIQKQFNKKFPFVKLDLTYQFEVSPKLKEESSTLETNEGDFEDDLYDEDAV